jgi:hypothetical protein
MLTFNTYSAVRRLTQSGMQQEQAEEVVKVFTEMIDPNANKLASQEQMDSLEYNVKNIMQDMASKSDLRSLKDEMHTWYITILFVIIIVVWLAFLMSILRH